MPKCLGYYLKKAYRSLISEETPPVTCDFLKEFFRNILCLQVTQACCVDISSMIKNFGHRDPLEFLKYLIDKTQNETNDSYLAKKMMIKYSDKSDCKACKRSK